MTQSSAHTQQFGSNDEEAMDIESDTSSISDVENNLDTTTSLALVEPNKVVIEQLNTAPNVLEITTYAEAAKTWLYGLKWKPYPPLLAERTVFGEEHDEGLEDIDSNYGLAPLFSDNLLDQSEAVDTFRPRSPLLHHNLDHREFIFAMLQKFASSTKTFTGPLTAQSVSALSKFSDSLIDDALSIDDERIHGALQKLIGDLNSRDTIVGELIDERKWDIAEELAADCVEAIVSRVSQEVDFYAPAPGVDRADPVMSMILAEVDWLLYEMVCYVGDEDADTSLYDEHFFGPSEEEKKKRKTLELQMKAKLEQKKQTAAPLYPLPIGAIPAFAPSTVPVVTEHHFGYNYIPQEALGQTPADADYWQAYYESQQHAAFVTAAAYSYTAKQHAQYVVAQAQANSMASQYQQYQPPVEQQAPPSQLPSTGQTKSTSLAVKFMQSALKSKSAVAPPVAPTVSEKKREPEKRVTEERRRKDEPDRSKDKHASSSSRSKSSKRRYDDSDDDDPRQDGPFYCMLTNLRSDTRASDIERAVGKVGRIESVKVLRDKAAKPPDNAIASITFRYVYRAAFDKLLSTGLDFNGKYRPIAKLQSDPFGSSN